MLQMVTTKLMKTIDNEYKKTARTIAVAMGLLHKTLKDTLTPAILKTPT